MRSADKPGQLRFFDLSADQVIVLARLVLASVSLLAIYVDPTQPSRYVEATYALLAGYVLFAILMAWLAFWRPFQRSTQMAAHLVDIGTFSLLMHFTDGPTSPFFVLFTFALLSATLSWGGRGAVLTALLLITLFVIVSLSDGSLFRLDQAEGSRLIMRSIYLVVAGGMLAYVGSYRERARVRLAKLAAWPPEQAGLTGGPSLTESFAHAADVTKARALVVFWETADGSDADASAWSAGRIYNGPELGTNPIDLVPPDIHIRPFTWSDGILDADGKQYSIAPDFAAKLRENWKAARAAIAPFTTPHLHGHVFVIDPYPFAEDVISLVEIVASRLGAELEHHVLQQKQRELAAAQERVRMARDIHDRLLQALTAAALHLKSAAQGANTAVAGTLDSVRAILANEQRQLREFIGQAHALSERPVFDFPSRCRTFLNEIESQWNCRTTFSMSPAEAPIDPELGRQILLMISEAAANACRHAKATRLEVEISVAAACTRVTIRDNGHGFTDIHGTIEHEELTRQNVGPVSIRNRVLANNGRMVLHSSSKGSAITIALGAH